MEGVSLRGCNFEDPAGTRANLEGKKLSLYDCAIAVFTLGYERPV